MNNMKRADKPCKVEHDWEFMLCSEPGCGDLGIFHFADMEGNCRIEEIWCPVHDPIEQVFESFMAGGS